MLKQLEMFGFKSFADRTAFDFVPGITCVVGPNGSGKSNVVDAIKWLLGDQSPKSLRGKEMADVIFNGAAGRKGSGFAEATLTFDNSEGRLPVDMAELQIGRRLYRSGESEYLLNGNVVRLKDIRDMLMGTGAGTSAYSIIEQGRVDQILQANPTTRRIVFEEAAGISKLKSRKIEAERKLERVDQNLVRLTDIVDEVETQLNATRNQASRAARFREVSGELKRIWTGLAADEHRHLSWEHEQLEADATTCREQAEALNDELSGIQQQNEAVDESLLVVDGELRKRRSSLTNFREQVAAHESTIRHQTVRGRELDDEIGSLRSERGQLVERLRFGARELRETGERLQQFEATLNEQQGSMQRREAQVAELQKLLEQARQQIGVQRSQRDRFSQQQTAHTNRAATLNSQAEANARALQTAHSDLEELIVKLNESARGRAEHQVAVTLSGQKFESAAERLKLLQDDRMRLLDEQSDSQKSLAVMREQRVAWEARIHVLENLERRQEGLGVGVRDILERARTLDAQPWNSIVGCVGELLNVPLEHAALVEVALGQRAQLVVTRNRAEVADYLNQTDAQIKGRVGFIEVGPQLDITAKAGLPDLTGEFGVVVRADRLASEPDEIMGLALRLLSRTWIVESLDDALRLAADVGRECQFVTLQGELLDANGVLFAGTVPTETSMVSRKSELRQLRLDLNHLDEEIDEQLNELAALGNNLTSVDGDLDAAAEARQDANEHLAEAKAQLRAQISECARLEQEQTRAQKSLDQLTADARQTADELSVAEDAAEDAAERSSRLADEIREAEAETNQLQAELSGILESIKREQLELAKHEERVVALRATQDRLERDQAQREQQAAEADARVESCVAARSKALLQALNAEAAVAGLFGRIEEQSQVLRELEREQGELRGRRAELHQTQSRLHRQKREISEASHKCEIRMNEILHQLGNLAERIHEEYQLSMDELVESGVSAYQDWLADQQGGDDSDDDRDDGDSSDETAEVDDAGTSYDEIHGELEERVQRLRRKLKSMGNVNIDALESLDELEHRYGHLSGQLQDLQEAQAALEDIIKRINVESRRMFLESFESIREHFRGLFRQLFGGGEADIVLEDPDDVLECGIDIVARPPGKELRSISLLSGGEKTLTAIALLFAMFKSNPSPYCVLDEVDAALDEANVERYASIVKEFVSMTQFIVITHRKRTMVAADMLYGVTMEQAGVSKRVSVRFEDVTENGEFRTPGRAA